MSRATAKFVVHPFETREAEASRQLFYYLAAHNNLDQSQILSIWMDAQLGVKESDVRTALDKATATREALNGNYTEERWSFYSLQRQFLTFIQDINLSEDTVPNGRGEIVYYNLGKFRRYSQMWCFGRTWFMQPGSPFLVLARGPRRHRPRRARRP